MPYVYSVRRRPAKGGEMAIVPPEPASVAKAEVVSEDAPVVAVKVETEPVESDAAVEVPTTPKPRKPRAKKSDG